MPPTARLLNLPNLLTLFRMAVTPLLVVLLLVENRQTCFWAALLFSLAAITDWLDGFLARRWHIVTNLGKFLDPLADKLMVMAAMIMLIPLDRLPAWAVFLILAREMVITGLRSIAIDEGIVIDASRWGKYKTIFQMVALVALLLHYDYYWLFGLRWELFHVDMHHVGLVFFYVSLVLTLWSGFDYLRKFSRVLAR